MYLSFPSKCWPRVCELWTSMARKPECKEVLCNLGPFLRTATCGRKLVRDIYSFCGWFQRGCSYWIGNNANAQKLDNRLDQIVSARNTNFNDLDLEWQEQWRILGWDEANWNLKRHGTILDGFEILLNDTNGFHRVLGLGGRSFDDRGKWGVTISDRHTSKTISNWLTSDVTTNSENLQFWG